jgi:hypothetical protein
MRLRDKVATRHNVYLIAAVTVLCMTCAFHSFVGVGQLTRYVQRHPPLYTHEIQSARRRVTFVVAIPSKASSYFRRTWMRQQIAHSLSLLKAEGKDQPIPPVIFILGMQGITRQDAANLTMEQAKYGDMLLLPDALDADIPDPPPAGVDSATCIKVLRAAAWAVQRYEFDYFVRLGDDTFFRIDYFIDEVLPTLPTARLLLGFCPPGLKYQFSAPHIANVRYCGGMGFVLSRDAAEYLATNQNALRKPWPEDAAVALWLAGTRTEIVHDDRFSEWKWRKCSNESIMIHKHKYDSVNSAGIMTNCFAEGNGTS